MTLSFRWKLVLSILLPILLMGGMLYIYLERSLHGYLIKMVTDDLLTEAKLARALVLEDMETSPFPSPDAAYRIREEVEARATIIAPDGTVIADSHRKPEELPLLENHLNRPEVRDAMATGTGHAIRYSATVQTDMLYVAVVIPVKESKGVLRLSIPLSDLKRTIASLHLILGVSVAAAVVFAVTLSSILIHFTSRSLKDMAIVAMHLGRGEFGRRIPVTGKDELGELAAVMNDMAAKLENQVIGISTEKNRLDAILRGMGEGLMVTDAEGTVTLVNPAFRQLFGIKEEVEGKPLIDITRLPALHEGFRLVITTKSERMEEMALPLPEERTVLTHWVPLMEASRIQGVVAVFHDISDIKKLEKVRRDFIANVSHELKTPVTVIKGYAETLLDGVFPTDPVKAKKFLEIIHSHSERLASLISDLLTLSQLETGHMALDTTKVNVERAVEHACSLLDQKAGDKKLVLRRERLEAVPQVIADPVKLEQVLVNLLDNAIKYTPPGGEITVAAREEAAFVRFSVADTGSGIPQKDLSRIFERFYRVDPARSRELGGTGLGLSIVKHIVQLHGGTVSVESTVGKGTTFSFTLRRA